MLIRFQPNSERSMTIDYINPPALYDGAPHGLSHATVDTDTGLVFVSGQVDWDLEYRVRHATLAEQTEGAARNLALVLEAAGSSIDRILQLRVYVRGEIGEHLGTMAPILVRHLGVSRPALTGIGVASLASPDTLIEIEAVAKLAR
jgi:2-iminobutanoate/2-iminopropanoate deaminase